MTQKLVNQWFYIRAESSPYWIDILIPEQWKLDDLDQFLRHIWLECCGHLSSFRIDKVNYERFEDEDWLMGGEELSPGMDIQLNKVLGTNSTFPHFYDYGSTTELQLKILEVLRFPVKKQILLFAQNKFPVFKCVNCKNSASHICTICQSYSCEKCAGFNYRVINDECDHIFSLLVNSPRTGICGYDGTVPGL